MAAILFVAALAVTRDLAVSPVTEWMLQFRLSDFDDWSYAWTFFSELRMPVPPPLAIAEIIGQLWWGDGKVVATIIYRASLVLSYLIPLWVFPRTRLELLLSATVGFVFLWAGAITSRPNAWAYDPALPFFVLSAIASLEAARRFAGVGAREAALCLLAGLFLSLAELTRPFVLLLMPMLLLCSWAVLRGLSRWSRLLFLLPVLLFSGGWHAQQFARHGQISWSNHGGFNVYRAWRDVVDDWPAFTREKNWMIERSEPGQLRGSGRFRGYDWNTDAHGEKSRELLDAVAAHAARHPVEATGHVAKRIGTLLQPQTMMWMHDPEHWVLVPYRLLVPLTAVYLVANVGWLAVLLLRERRLGWLERPETPLLLVAFGSVAILAAGEIDEEARLIVTVLPFFAALPRVFHRDEVR